MSTNIATRQFGQARVSVVQTARCRFQPSFPNGEDWRTSDTVVDERGMALIDINVLVIETDAGAVIVDPSSFGPDDTTLGGGSIIEPGPSLDTALDQLGVDVNQVELVLVTHGHDDHFNGVLDGERVRFPNAEHYFPRADWELLQEELSRGEGYNTGVKQRLLKPVQDAGRLRLVTGDLDLGDGLSLLATPGESPGHQVVRLDTGEERLYYLGDLAHFPMEFQELRAVIAPRPDPVDVLEQSRIRVLEDAAVKPSTLVFTHGLFPAWGVAERTSPSSWTWRYL